MSMSLFSSPRVTVPTPAWNHSGWVSAWVGVLGCFSSSRIASTVVVCDSLLALSPRWEPAGDGTKPVHSWAETGAGAGNRRCRPSHLGAGCLRWKRGTGLDQSGLVHAGREESNIQRANKIMKLDRDYIVLLPWSQKVDESRETWNANWEKRMTDDSDR